MAKDKTVKVINKDAPMGFVLFAAWFGALAYFVQNSEGFGGFLLAIVKACVWPGIVLHRVLELLAV